MSYYFERQDTATFKFNAAKGDTLGLSLKGINATEQDANVILNGIYCLLNIGGIAENYRAGAGERTVQENVDEA